VTYGHFRGQNLDFSKISPKNGQKSPKNQKIENLSGQSLKTIYCINFTDFWGLGAKIAEEVAFLPIFKLKLRNAQLT
jgi:hypothetical protein